MSLIIENLYLGSQDDAFSSEFMSERPTAVLNVAAEVPRTPHTTVDYLHLPLRDTANQELLDSIIQANEFIERNRKLGVRVLVHCFAGISRSASIVIAYLMQLHNMTFSETHEFVKKKRPVINPNMSFVFKLYAYECLFRDTY